MRLSRSRPTVALAAAGALLAGGLTAAAGASPAPAPAAAFDYTAVKGLSQPTGVPVAREVLRVPAADGTSLYVEVVKPTTGGRFPVVLEASPYHGTVADRDGTRILPDPRDDDGKSLGLTGFFAPRGYAVALMDLRGTGRSGGCLDHLGPKDASDLKTVVEFLADAEWSTGSVGMTGHSYVGSTPMVAAAQKPRGLKTIVPSAGLASMYDHQFQAGVPYNLQYAGPIFAYETLALQRHLPPGFTSPLGGPTGDDFGGNLTSTGCGLPQSSAAAGHGQVTGQYQDWHAQRDHSRGATESDVPAFLVHGVNDNAARITAADWFMDRGAKAGDKAWIGQWDHGSGFAPTRRGDQWPFALLGWFDKHLKGRPVDTGPAAEVFLNDAATLPSAISTAQGQTLQADGFPAAAPSLTMFASGTGLTATAPAAGSRSFRGTASGGNVEFVSAPLTEDVTVAGVPAMTLAASVSVPQVNLIASLYERRGTTSRRISQCTIVPLLKDGVDTVSPVVPGTVYELEPPCFAMGHTLREGSSLVLRVATTDPDKVSTWANDPQITVATGAEGTRVSLPVVTDPVLVADTVDLQP